jgi:hypothetical protein
MPFRCAQRPRVPTQPSHDRLATVKRGSIGGLRSILNAPPGSSPYSSSSSIDGRVSPSPSFATSTHEVILSAVYLFVSCLPTSFRLKRMTTAFAVRIRLQRRPVSRTKSWHFSVLPGRRRACYAASNTGSRLGGGQGQGLDGRLRRDSKRRAEHVHLWSERPHQSHGRRRR